MRHPVSTILPPGRSLEIPVDPPIADDERPLVLTMNGHKDSVTLIQTSPSVIVITNMTDKIAPALFIVVKRTGLIPRILNLANFVKG